MTAKTILFFCGLCILGVAAAGLMFYVTPFGIGIWLDSLHYVSAAESFVNGLGFGRVSGCGSFKPMTHYPPLYSLSLAAFSSLGLSPVRAAQVVSALSFGSIVTLSGWCLYRMNRSRLLALSGAAIVLISAITLKTFSWALSEPLYVALYLASFVLLSYYLNRLNSSYAIAAGVFLGLAFLTRYVGVAAVISVGLIIFLNHRLELKHRLRDIAVVGILSVGPMLLWLIRNYLWMGTTTDRNLGLHLPGGEVWTAFTSTILGWFLPKPWTTGHEIVWFLSLSGLLFLLLGVRVYRIWRRGKLSWQFTTLEMLFMTGILTYLVLLGLSLSFIDPNTALNDRILIPVYIQVILLLVSLTGKAIQSRRVIYQAMGVIGLGVFLAWQTHGGLQMIQEMRKDGQGYASSLWRSALIVKELKELHPSLVYSNDITAVYFLVGAPACSIPTQSDSLALVTMRDKLNQAHTVLAIFGRKVSSEFASYEEIRKGMHLIYDQSDGEILVQKGSP